MFWEAKCSFQQWQLKLSYKLPRAFQNMIYEMSQLCTSYPEYGDICTFVLVQYLYILTCSSNVNDTGVYQLRPGYKANWTQDTPSLILSFLTAAPHVSTMLTDHWSNLLSSSGYVWPIKLPTEFENWYIGCKNLIVQFSGLIDCLWRRT